MGEILPEGLVTLKQRIVDGLFDDVVKIADTRPAVRKEKQDQESVEAQLDFNKSRVGLAAAYEEQYEKEVFGNATAQEEHTDKKLQACKEIFGKLMFQLDQLTNSRYTPKPVSETVAALRDADAIAMEDVVPITNLGNNSAAAQKAPQEIVSAQRHVKSHAELERQELRALHRRNKAERRQKDVKAVREGTMTLANLEEKKKALAKKNKRAKEIKLAHGKVKDKQPKKIKSSQLLAAAAENVQADVSRKAEMKKYLEGRNKGDVIAAGKDAGGAKRYWKY